MSSERGTEPRPTRRRGLDRIAFRMAGPALLIVVIVAIGNTLVLLNTGTATDRHDHSREMSQLRMIVGDAALLAKAAANDERGFLLFADPQFIEGFQADRIDPLNELVDEIVDQASDETSGLAASYRDQVRQWITLVEEEFALRLDDREPSEQFHAEVVRPARKIYEGTGNELVAAIDLDLADSDTSFNTALASTETAAAAALVVSTLAAFLGAAWLTRSTGRPIRALAAQADRLAAGEITVAPVTVRRGDEIGVLASSFNKLSGIVQIIGSQAQSIADGRLDADAIDDQVPGPLGQSFGAMVDSLSRMVDQLKQSSAGLAGAANELERVSVNLGGENDGFAEIALLQNVFSARVESFMDDDMLVI